MKSPRVTQDAPTLGPPHAFHMLPTWHLRAPLAAPCVTLQVYDPAEAALRDMLARVEAGAYRSESLRGIVALGKG